MAARHLQTLVARQPGGPYRLGGYCNGGLVAYEVARQLAARGATVERLVLIAAAPDLRLAGLRRLLDRAAWGLGMAPERPSELFGRLRAFLTAAGERAPRDRLAFALHKLARRLPPRRWRDPASKPDLQAMDLYYRAVMAYVPGRFPGRVAVLWPADEPSPTPGDPGREWRALAPAVEVHPIPGDHDTAVLRHADLVGERLARCLTGGPWPGPGRDGAP
jgi:thioesterase domain-containing protein